MKLLIVLSNIYWGLHSLGATQGQLIIKMELNPDLKGVENH